MVPPPAEASRSGDAKQLGEQLLRGQHRPEPLDRRVEAEVRAQVVAQRRGAALPTAAPRPGRRSSGRSPTLARRSASSGGSSRSWSSRSTPCATSRPPSVSRNVIRAALCGQAGGPRAPSGPRAAVARSISTVTSSSSIADRRRRAAPAGRRRPGAGRRSIARPPFVRATVVLVDGGRDDAVRQPAGGGEHHRRLAQRGEHAPDVADERRRWGRRPARRCGPAARGGCRAGRRRGAARPRSSRSPGRPRSRRRRRAAAG